MGTAPIPLEFLEPEGDGERQDPDLVLEATTASLRTEWEAWMCRRGSGAFVDIQFFGRRIGGVPAPAVDAYRSLERALRSSGYVANSCWAYNCRVIAGTDRPSLHSAGIAVDIDPGQNPYTDGDPFAGKLRPGHVVAVMAIRNDRSARVWSWGGHWPKPDRMHFQLDQGPSGMGVDWSSVPGSATQDPGPHPDLEREEELVLSKGMENQAVQNFQRCLLAWDGNALPRHGADGDYGSETVEWVGRFQNKLGLPRTGTIDGVTAALLAMYGAREK